MCVVCSLVFCVAYVFVCRSLCVACCCRALYVACCLLLLCVGRLSFVVCRLSFAVRSLSVGVY